MIYFWKHSKKIVLAMGSCAWRTFWLCCMLLRALVLSACVRHCMNSRAPTVGVSQPKPCSHEAAHISRPLILSLPPS